MGSGSSGPYSGTNGGSQPYSGTYHVYPKEFAKDKSDNDIYNSKSGYFKNPTSTDLSDAVNGNSIYFNGMKANGTMTYVMDDKGNIIFGKRANPNNPMKRAPHPTLVGGTDPQVQCAGMITFSNGKIVSVNNESGHFRPNIKSLDKVDQALKKLYEKNPYLFSKKSKWRK